MAFVKRLLKVLFLFPVLMLTGLQMILDLVYWLFTGKDIWESDLLIDLFLDW